MTAPITLQNLTFNASGSNLTSDGNAGSNTLTLAAGNLITANTSGSNTISTSAISAVVAGADGLNLSSNSTGTLALTNTANTFSGLITINSGTLAVAADGSLGAAGNDITFNNGTGAAGLTLNAPMVLGSGRTITLSNSTGLALLTSVGAAQQSVLGQITGAGTFGIANAGTTYLLNSTNDYSGVLWAQSGMVSVQALPDAAGNGNIKLGSVANTGGLQWATGVTSPLTLTNRSIELAGTTGGGTIDSSSIVAANSVTINNNLLFTTASSGAKTLTLQGVNGGTNTFAGNITNNGTSATALTKSGQSLWQLTGTGNNYTGAITINQGTLKVTDASGLGGTGTLSFATSSYGQGIDYRADTTPTGVRSINNNSATNAYIYIDHAATAGNTVTGQTMTFGTVAQANSSALFSVVGNHGYGAAFGLNTLAASNTTAGSVSSYTISNYLGSPGLTGYSLGANEFISIAGFAESGGNTGGVTQNLNGWGNFTVTGPISNTGTQPLNITKSGLGVLTFSPTNVSGWTTGTLTTSGGTTVMSNTSVGTGNLNLSGGALAILSDTGTSGAAWTGKNLTIGGAGTLIVDPTSGSTATNQTVNLGAFNGGGASNTTYINSNHGYGITFNTAGTQGTFTSTLTNVGNGTVAFAGGLTASGTAVYALNGPGDFNIPGNITAGTGSVALTKSGYGMVTLSGTNTIGGNTTVTSGILRITNPAALGGAGALLIQGGNNNTLGGVGLDLRNDTGMDLSAKTFASGDYNFVVNVDKASGGSGTNQTMSLGGGVIAANNGWGFGAIGANGYSLQFKGAAFQEATNIGGYTINNFIPSLSGNGKLEFNSGITFNSIATASGLTLAGTGDYLLSGALTGTGASAVATLTKNGTGTLTVSTDNSATWNVATNNVLTQSAGIIRATASNALGGSSAIYNLNTGVLDLRSDAGITLPTVKIGAVNSTINVDRAVGGSGTGATHTITALNDSGVFSLYATGGTQSGGSAYNLGVTTFTVGGAGTAAIPTLINSIGNGGAVNIATLTGANLATVINGSGNTNVSTAQTLGSGALTKSGTGTLTISGPAGYAATNTNGAITVNGGTLALNFSGITTPTNLLQSAAITLGAANAGGVSGGTLSIKGANSATNTTQTLTTVAFQAGQDNITMIAGGGAGTTTLTFTGASTAANAGATALITIPATTSVVFNSSLTASTAQGRNLVIYDGTSYNWATNGGTNSALTPLTVTTALPTTGGTSTTNYAILTSGLTAGVETLTGSVVGNSLQVNTGTTGTGTAGVNQAATLALGNNLLTLTQGGILYSGGNDFTISGTSPTNGIKPSASGGDVVINNYGSGTLNVQAPIIANGTSTLTLGGTGTTVLGNSAVLPTVGTYTGITYVNGGTVKLASGITGLGAAASNTALTQNGGTLDINGNTVNIGALNGGPAAVIDNNPTSTTAAQLTIGSGGAITGTFNGTIKDTNGALTIIKAGTGTMTLGDAVTGGSNLFTGNLKFTGASTLNVNSLADAAGAKVDFSVSGANLTFVGRDNLTLNNRAFDISAASGTATITSSSVANSINGTNAVMTIGSAFAPTGTGTLGLTLQGSSGNIANGGTGTSVGNGLSGITGSGNVAVVNSFNGDISNGAGTLGLTIAGNGGWSLGGNNSYTGGTTISSTGLVRATSATAFGTGTVSITGAAVTLDLRSDSGLTFANTITTNQSFTINTDRAVGGSGYGQVMNIGSLTQTGAAKTITVTNLAGVGSQTGSSGNIVGYGLHMTKFTLGVAGNTVIQNSLGSPGSAEFVIPAAGSGAAGELVIDGVTTADSLGATTLTLGNTTSNNFGVAVINGDIKQTTGSTLGLTVAGGNGNAQFVTLANQTSSTNYGGGLTISPGTGGATVRITNANALGSGSVTFGGANGLGTLEVRNDSSLTFTNGIVVGTSAAKTSTLTVGEALNGSSGRNNNFTFGQLTFQGFTGNILNVAGIGGSNNNSGDSVTFTNGVNLNGNYSATVNNNLLLPGMLSLGNITSAGTSGTQTLTIGGAGVTTVGDVTNSSTVGALTGLAYTGSGILDLSRMTAATNYGGGFTQNGPGTTRVTAPSQFGTATGFALQNGTIEARSDTAFTYAGPVNWNANNGNVGINVGELGTGTTTGVGTTFNFGALNITNASGKTLSIGGIGNTGASSSDSVVFSGVTFGAGNLNNTITNNLSLPGTLSLGNITGASTTAATLTISGAGFTSVGDITNGSNGGVTTLSYSGTGILQVNGSAAFTGGINISGNAGILRLMGASSIPSTGTIAMTYGTLDIRTDASLTVNNAITMNSNNTAINVDQATTGSLSDTVTFNGAATTLASGTAKTLTLTSGANYGMTFTNGFISQVSGNVITNNASGTVNLGPISYSPATVGSLTINGSGTSVVGNITGSAAAPTLTYSGTGLLDLTGNNGSTNPMSALTVSGAGSVVKANAPVNLGAANDTVTFSATTAATLMVRNDNSGASNGSIAFGNTIALNGAGALAVIDVGNTGASSVTGNTVVFGALNNSAGANAGTLTVNGANGYGASFTSMTLPSGNGNNTTVVANAPLTITGNVGQSISPVAAHYDTLFLDGVSAGVIGGVISDSTTGGVTVGNGDTRITKQGTGTWTLTGASTYTGPTTVNAGTLVINGSTGTSAFTVNGSNVTTVTAQSNATVAPNALLTGAGTIGGAVTLAASTATSFAQGPVMNPGTVGAAGTLTINGTLTTGNYSNLGFDIAAATTVGSGINDLISTSSLPVINGSTQVSINTLGLLSVGTTYTLINGYSGSIANPANLSLAPFTGVDTTHTGVLVSSNGLLQLVIANPVPTSAYWSGSIDGNWNTAVTGTAASNWRTDATSNTDTYALPGATTDVHFVTSNPTAANFTTTLGQAFAIKSLSFDSTSTAAVTITGSSLSLTPSSSSTGITMDAAAGAVTINSALTLGAAQTWTNNSTTNALTVSGAIANGGNTLTIAGPGTVNSSGIISGAGGLAVTNGTFAITQQASTFSGNITVDGPTSVLSMVGNSGGTYSTTNPLGYVSSSVYKTVTLTNGGTFTLAGQNYNVNAAGAGQVFMIGSGGGTFNVASGSTFTLDDGTTTGTSGSAYEMQGTGDLTKTGAGTLVLRYQNSYSGAITIAAGTLKASGTTIASSSAGITVQSGAALDLAGQGILDTEGFTLSGTGLSATVGALTNSSGTAASYTGNITLAATSAIGGTGAITLSGVVGESGAGSGLTKVGAGAVTLSNTANTYTGPININGGTLSVASLADTGTGSNGTGNIVFNNASTAGLTYTGSGATLTRGLTFQGSAAVSVINNGTGALILNGTETSAITANTTLTLGGSYVGSNNEINGVLADNGSSVLSLAKTGPGNWTLGGANTFTGNVSIATGNPGALILTNSLSLGVGPKTVSLIDTTSPTSASIQLNGSAGDITLASNISWTTSSVNGTGGIVNIAGNNTINGNFTLTSGGGSTQFTSNGGTLNLAGTISPNTTSRFLILNGTTTGNIVSGVVQNGSTTNTLGVIKQGTGEWILTAADTYTVGTQVQNGTLRLAGGDNRLLSTGAGATNVVTLGSATANTNGKLAIGGDATGGTGVGTQHTQTLTQNSTTSVLTTAGTGTRNSVIGASDGGTSAGTPANNSIINLNIGTGYTDTYTGLIGWDGVGSVGFQNNINLQKSGGGTLVLSADLSNWTGLNTDGGPNVTGLSGDATRPEIILSGGVLRLTNTAVINTVIRNTGGVIDDLGATYGSNYFLVVSGGLISFSQASDTFTNSGLTSASHGVGAINVAGNTVVTDYAGSDMYLGAVGARVFAGTSLAAGSGATYRLGGGAPWQALGSASVGGSGGYLQLSGTNAITGANKLIVGDNGSYNGGAGLFGSNSTVDITAAQNYTGTSTLAGGTFIFSNAAALGTPSTAAGSIILDGGILRYGAGLATDLSNRMTIASGGTIDTNNQSLAFVTAIGNSNTGTSGLSNGGLGKNGLGTLTLSKANTYTGVTTVNQGTLSLDFNQASAATSDIVSNAAAGLTLTGGTLTVNAKGAANINNQRFVATNLTSGTVLLNLTTSAAFSGSGAENVALGQISRSVGSGLNIVAGTNVTLGTTGKVTTTSLNTNGIISGGISTSGTGITGNTWAVSGATSVAGVNWDSAVSSTVLNLPSGSLTNDTMISFSGTAPAGLSTSQAYYVVNASGTSFGVATSVGGTAITLTDANTTSINQQGAITGLAPGSYYTTTTGGNTASNYVAAANVDVTSSPTLSAGVTVNSLRFSSTTAQTLTFTGANTISSGGILISSAVGNVATAITGGTIMGAVGGDLIINNYDTSNTFTINSIIADNGTATGLTKNGTGTVAIGTSTNSYSGQTVINGGTLTMDAQARYGSTSGFTFNGGTLNWSATGSSLPKDITLGLNGGTINVSAATSNLTIGNATPVLFQGLGARSLTLTAVADRKTTFQFSLGDNGGPTSLTMTGLGDNSLMSLTGSNTYTGTTTINRGILDLGSAGALPGGLGSSTGTAGATSANTGGGNLTFAGSGSNRAILQFNAATNGGFYRSLGTGIDQVQWTGNGGFANNTTGTIAVNLGAASAGVTWGSGGFVPTGNVLQFGQATGNSLTSGGAIDFQNPINLGTAARTVDVSNGLNGSSATSGVDAILSGALTGGVGGGLTKTGLGVLKLTANNSTGTNVNAPTLVGTGGGILVLASTGPADVTALPGSGATNQTLTINVGGAAVLSGQSDPTALLNRVVTTSAGAVSLDTNSSATIDLSAFSSLGLGAYSDVGGTPVYFSGTIIPNSNTYRFNSGQTTSGGAFGAAATSVQAAINLLVLSRSNTLVDNGATPRLGNFASGEYYITGYNAYSGGTSVGSVNSAYGASTVGVGNDSAFGTGAITASPSAANTAYFGSVNGDHTLSNNITLGTSGNLVLTGNTLNRGIANPGAMTYAGTMNLPATVNLYSEGGMDAIILGDLKPSGASTSVILNNNSGGLYSFLTLPNGAAPKSQTSTVINNVTDVLVIDSDRSLGAVPSSAATNLTFSTGAGTLEVQPGTASVSLSANRNIALSSNIGAVFNVPGGTVPITGVTTGGLNPNSTLTIPGVISGGGTGVLSKTGLGTLVLQGTNTATDTATNGFQVIGGTLQLDYANLAGAGPILNNTTTMALTLGSGSNNVNSNGGTLAITNGANAATQNFTSTQVNAKDNFIKLDSTGGAITLGLGTNITRQVGGTLNFTGNALSGATINSAYAPVNGIVQGATWGGTDLVAASGTALTKYTAYTTPTGAGATIASNTATNVKIDNTSTGNTVLGAGTTSINTLTFADSSARTIGVGSGNTLNFGVVGQILDGTGSGALTIGVSGAAAGTITAGGTVTNTAGELIFTNNSSNTMTVNSVIANNGTGATSVVKSGSGILTLAGANTFTGGIFIDNGVVQYSDGSAGSKSLGNPTAGATNIILNGGALRYTGTASNNLVYGATFNSVSAIDVPSATGIVNQTAQSMTGIAGVVGIMQKTGAGALTFSGSTDNANLSVEVVGGTLNMGKASASNVHSVSGGMAAAALVIDSGATANITGTGGDQIYDGSSVVVKSGGTLNLSSTLGEAFDGLAGAGTVTSTGAVTLTLGGSATVTNNESNIGANTLAAANAGVAATGLNNFSGVIGGSLALTKFGAGTQILGGLNTYSGATTIQAGTLKMGIANAMPSGAGKGDVTIVGNTVINALTVPGNFDLGGYSQNINALNSTTGGLVTNTPTLSNNGTAWGVTAGPSGFQTSGFTTASTTNTLTLGNNNATGSFNGSFQDGYTVIPNPGTGGDTGVYGYLAVTKVGSGTQTLAGASTATGALTVNAGEVDLNNTTTGTNAWSGNVIANPTGTVKLLQSNQIADTSTISVAGGTFQLNGKTETVAGVSLTADGLIADSVGGGSLTSTTAFDLQKGTASAVLAGTAGANKTTADTVTLSGANTYTGVTNVSNGTLAINGGAGGSLGGTTVNVATGATLSILGNTTLGTTSAGSVTVNPGGTLSMTDAAINTLTLNNTTAGNNLTLGGASGSAAALTFEFNSTGAFGTTTNDLINVGQNLYVDSTGATVSLVGLSGSQAMLPLGNYTLMTFGSESGSGAITFVGGATSQQLGGGLSYTLVNNTGAFTGKLELVVAVNAAPATAYWTGTQNTSWSTMTGTNATNWSSNLAGTTDANQLPGVNGSTDVVFTATNATTPVTTTLDGSYTVNSLTFSGTGPAASGATTINSGTGGTANALTIGAGGITVQSGDAGANINTNIVLGASQTWTNDSSTGTSQLNVAGGTITGSGTTLTLVDGVGSTTTISDSIQTGTGGLTVQGGGTAVLSGANTYTGVTTITGGTLSANTLTNGGTASSIGQSTSAATNLVLDGGTLAYTGPATSTDRLFTVTANGGTIDSSGTGPLTLTNTAAESFTGGSPTLTLTGSTLGNSLAGQITDPTSGGGTTSVAITGTGSWNLANTTNNYTGSTTVGSGATLNVTTLANGGTASGVGASTAAASNLVLSGGTLQYTGSGTTSGTTDRSFTIGGSGATLDASGASGSPLVLTSTTAPAYSTPNQAETLTLSGSNTGANTLAAPLTDNGTGVTSLTKTGTGTWTLTGAGTNTGTTTVSGGTLVVNNSTGDGTGTGAINVTSGSLQVGVGGVGSTSASSTITAAGTAGTPTTTSGVDSNNTPVTGQNVVSAPTVSGTGTIGGNVVIGSGLSVGVLMPGDTSGTSDGKLSIGGNLTVNTGSQVQMGLGTSSVTDPAFIAAFSAGATALSYLNSNGGTGVSSAYSSLWATPAGSYDTISVGGSLTINSSGTGGTNTPSILLNATAPLSSYSLGGVFKLLDWTGLNGSTAFGGTFALGSDLVLPDLTSQGLSWDTTAFTTYGVIVVVPEPGRVMMLLIGISALMLRRRKRE